MTITSLAVLPGAGTCLNQLNFSQKGWLYWKNWREQCQAPGGIITLNLEKNCRCSAARVSTTAIKFDACQRACQQTDCSRCRPPAARVSGIVEESPGNLEYEVALFREASRDEEVSSNEVPVDQAVAIGTKLQLRATINSQQSGETNGSILWTYKQNFKKNADSVTLSWLKIPFIVRKGKQ